MDKPKASNSNALSFAKSSVLSPMSRQNANNISAPVAIAPTMEIMPLGNQGLICPVYSRKLFQFPQAETSAFHHPNLSATAERKPAEMDKRKNNLVNLGTNGLLIQGS